MRVITAYTLAALGGALALWVLYNLFVELRPEARGTSPAPALFLGAALIAVGVSRATGGRWRSWALWRDGRTYWVAALCLLALVLAYVYNVWLRLHLVRQRPLGYLSLVADAVFMFMCARIFMWLFEGWRSVSDAVRRRR